MSVAPNMSLAPNMSKAPVGVLAPAQTTPPVPNIGPVVGPLNYASMLPKSPTSPTGPTGVATSGLADETIASQEKGYSQLSAGVDQHEINKKAEAANPKVSIVDFLNSKGLPSDFSSRAKMAKVAGMTDYVGTADQNARLLGWMSTPGMAGDGTMQGGAPTDGSGGSQNGSGTTKTTTTTGITDVKTGSPGDAYNKPISDIQDQMGKAYDDFNTQVTQIRNGTFPLTAAQQAILDSTQKKFDELARLQVVANTSYENSVALAGNRLGLNVQNPTEYVAKGVQAISDGLTRISNLDATAAKTMAELRQSFMDKDYEMINNSYNALQKVLENKAKAIGDLQDRVDGLYKDTRAYDLKVKEYELNKQKTAADIQKIQHDIAKDGATADALLQTPFGKNVSNALAGIRFSSVNERQVATAAIMSMIGYGDIPGAQEQLKQYAYNSMPSPVQQTLTAKDDAVTALRRIQTGLDTLKAKGIDTGFMTGLSEKALKKGGFLKDPTLNAISEDIALAVVDYRHAVTGAAFTASEGRTYDSLFPSTGKTPELNKVIIDTLINKFEGDIDNAYNARIAGYEKINSALNQYQQPKQDLQKFYISATPEVQKSIDTLVQGNPNLSDEDIMQIIKG